MSRSRFTLAERVAQLEARGLTQRAIGARIGVSDRQVRRYKSGETRAPRPEIERALVRESNRARSIVRAQAERATRGRQPSPADAPVIVRGERRTLRKYRNGKPVVIGRRRDGTRVYASYESKWVNYDVRGLSREQIIGLMESIRRRSRSVDLRVQLIYYAPQDDPSKSGRVLKDRIRAGSTAENMMLFRDAGGVARFYDREILPTDDRYIPLYVAVLDTNG